MSGSSVSWAMFDLTYYFLRERLKLVLALFNKMG